MPSNVALVQPNQPPAVVAPEGRRDLPVEAKEFKAFGADGLTFDDVLDVINPLHHLPVVGFIYRSITGDTISPASKVAGGALFGGVVGLAASVADTLLQETSGKDATGHIVALVEDVTTPPGGGPSQPQGQEEERWSATASLRHDGNEHDDEIGVTESRWTTVAQLENQGLRRAKSQAVQTASLRHDANELDYGAWEDPDAVAKMENVAVIGQPTGGETPVPASAPAASAQIPERSTSIDSKATPGQSSAKAGAVQYHGPRALGGVLPQPPALAASPAMVTALQKGKMPIFQPGGRINPETWLKMINSAGANRSDGGPRTGASGLTSATLAKALATYGAAEAVTPEATPGSTRP